MLEFPEKNLYEYYQSIKRAIQNESSQELSRLLSIDLVHRPSYIRFIYQNDSAKDASLFDPTWWPIVDSHIKSVRYLHESEVQLAFNEKTSASNELSKLMGAQRETNWCIDFMNKHSVDLRRLAIKADANADIRRSTELAKARAGDDVNDQHGAKLTKKDENMERACECLMQLFRVCATDTRSTISNTKRIGMICIINQLFKIYFRINKLHLCKPLIRALDNANIFEHCSLAQRVTYNYYLGVKTLFDLKILEAEKLLDFVFANCHPGSRKNIRLTLIFLIPIKMLLGRMPSNQLLEKYDLKQFEDIKKAVISGRVGDLDAAIENRSDFLWRYGIYLIIERLRPITLRNLFKKVAKCAKSHLVDLEMILTAVKLVQPDEEVKMEEVHCMLSNLIYEGKIKGYLSIGHSKLVLSKLNPFPL